MSWTDEEIDKLAREGAANSSVEYKNEYWTEFEAMLPASGKRDILWFFTAFLFVGLLGTSFVLNGLRNDTVHQTAQTAEKKIESIQKIEKENKHINISDATTSKDKTSDESEQLKAPSSEGSKSTESMTENGAGLRKTVQTQRTTNSNNKTEKQPLKTIPSTGLNASIGSPYSQTSTAVKPEEDAIADTKLNSNQISVSQLPFRGLNEFGLSASLMPAMDFSKQKLPARASFYVNGFGGLSQSLITPSKDISTSFGLGFGAQIQKGKFTFTTGVNGVWSNHKDLNLSRSTKVYGFGSNEYNYQFRYKQIYLIEAELTAGYKMGKHLINVGVRPSFVIGTKVAVVQSVNDEKTIDGNEYGYVDGLNRFGIKPTLGYSFDITPSLKIGLNVGVELMTKIQEGYLVGSNNRFPIDGQLYLRKSIRFKK